MWNIPQHKTEISIGEYSINLLDSEVGKVYIGSVGYRPLIEFISQQTNESAIIMPTMSVVSETKNRYIQIFVLTWFQDILNTAVIQFGTPSRPYGLYDMKIYANKAEHNMTIGSDTVLIHTGLANVYPKGDESPTYSPYTANDNDNDVVYLTNESG